MKRVVSFLLICVLLLGCAACAGSTVPAAGPGRQELPLRGEEPQLPAREDPAGTPEKGGEPTPPAEGAEEGDAPGLPGTEGASPEEPRDPEEPYVRTVDPAKPMVALTFDDGPHKTYTDQILDILEENRAVATFFEVGRNVASCPGPLSRMAELGCEIGSHSNAHKDLSKLKTAALEKDLDTADQAFIDAVGFAPTLLRPPYGAVNKTVKYGTGRTVITWTVDTEDWLSQDTEKVVSYVQSLSSLDGEIVLLHSTYETTVEAVRRLVPWLQEQGYQLVTVSELMAYYYGELLEPGEFFGYTYFTTHGRTDAPAVLPDASAGGEGTQGEAPESAPAEGTEPGAAQPPAAAEQPGEPTGPAGDSGTASAVPEAPSSGDAAALNGSGTPETVRAEKPVIPGAPAGNAPAGPDGDSAGEEAGGGVSGQIPSL